MSTEGWIFIVGFRIFDVGLLVAWLVWFFHFRVDEDDEPGEEDGGGGGGSSSPGPPRRGPGGGGLPLPGGRWLPGRRLRDGHRPASVPHRRRAAPPLTNPLPARVRSPASTPAKITRR